MTRLADPVLKNLAERHAQGADAGRAGRGADRRAVSHLEALGRLLAGMAPWIELGRDDASEGRCRAEYADLARRAIARAVDPASPDFLNFTRERQPLVDAAFLAQAILRAPRALRGVARCHRPRTARRRARVDARDHAGVQQLAAVFGDGRSGARASRRQLGSDARRLRAAAARPVVQGRRRLRRRAGVPLGLLQQLRHPADAARRARRVPRRDAGVEGARDPRRAARAAVCRHPRAADRAGWHRSRRSAGRSRIASAPSSCWRRWRCARRCPRACRRRRCAARCRRSSGDRSRRQGRSTPTAGCASGSAVTSRASARPTSRPAASICAPSACCRSACRLGSVLVRTRRAVDVGARLVRPAVPDRSRDH